MLATHKFCLVSYMYERFLVMTSYSPCTRGNINAIIICHEYANVRYVKLRVHPQHTICPYLVCFTDCWFFFFLSLYCYHANPNEYMLGLVIIMGTIGHKHISNDILLYNGDMFQIPCVLLLSVCIRCTLYEHTSLTVIIIITIHPA